MTTSAIGAHSPIATPDRRVRVFVSSTLAELADERGAAREAITGLHLTPVMFEVGARPHPARELYRAYLAQSDVFVGIYWQRYGWVAPGEAVSGLEDEYLLAGDRPKLIYVKAGTEREPRLTDLLARVQDDGRASYKHFGDADDLTELLADDLAVLLTERFSRSAALVAGSPRAVAVPSSPTGIVGRDDEVATVSGLLRDPAVHLVTLIGPGGMGKTRLALEVARSLGTAVPDDLDRVSFVDLAPVRDAALWPATVAAALGVRPEGAGPLLDLIVDRLQGFRVLLVLDNVEQLLPAAPDLGRLLAACPDLTVLVTSRVVLRLKGEREVVLDPLPIPAGDGSGDTATVAGSAAVQLLVDRARQVRPTFAVTPVNAAAVAELCRRLEGIPLALELAAAQLRLLTPMALARRLADRLGGSLDLAAGAVDAPDRQRTLRATIDWSHSLLGEAERTLLARLSVFTGAWTMDACEAVGTVDGDMDASDVLSSLVAQSLVRIDDSDPDELRFRMLDTIRLYAGERLAERGEADDTDARLARYLLGVVAAVRDGLQGPEHLAVSARLDRELDDLRSALDRALGSDDAATVGLLIMPLFTYWWSRGLLPETHDLAERAALLPSASHLEPYADALLLGARGMAMVIVGEPAQAEPLLRRTVAAATALGNDRLRAYGLLGLGSALTRRSVGEACSRLDDAVEAFRHTGDRWGLALTLSTRGQLALLDGDAGAAQRMHLDALGAAEAISNEHLQAQLLDMLGLDAVATGDAHGARERYVAAAALHTRLLDYEGSAYCLSGLAGLAMLQGDPGVAARLLGASDRARRVVGTAIWPGMASVTETQREALVTALGRTAAARAGTAGEEMGISDALAYGLAATSTATARG